MPNKLDNIETLTDLDLSHNDLPRGTIFKREISRELKKCLRISVQFSKYIRDFEILVANEILLLLFRLVSSNPTYKGRRHNIIVLTLDIGLVILTGA